MTRGTTPKLTFTLPFSTEDINLLYVTFSQEDGQVTLEKSTQDCELEDNKIVLHLSQEDTLSLTELLPTYIQIRIKTNSGEAIASNIIKTETRRILKDGTI